MAAQLTTDILILGTGGAGLMAALHAFWRDPSLNITLVSKGMLGKSGCTRMVQGGFNVVLNPKDSVQADFEDTVKAADFSTIRNWRGHSWKMRHESSKNWKIGSAAFSTARWTGKSTRKHLPDKPLTGRFTLAI